MPRFDRYLLGQLILLFGFFGLVLMSIYWINRGVVLFDRLISDGQSAFVFMEFVALTLPNVTRLVLPIAAFAATLYAVNRMNRESELVVMQAAGCSPWRLARPILMFGCLVALIMAVLTHFVVPASRAQLKLREDEISQNISGRLLVAGQFLHPIDGITIFIRKIEAGGEIHDLYLSDLRTEPGTNTAYTAKRAFLTRDEAGPALVMFDGMAQSLNEADQRLSLISFENFVFHLGNLIETRGQRTLPIETLSTATLLKADPKVIRRVGESRAAFLYEGHARTAQPLLAVAGALIGYGALMLGAYSRFGLGRQVGVAIVLLLALQLLDNTGGELARRDAHLWPLTYMAPLAGMAVGALLIFAATRRWARPSERRGASA
ncbi:LPS export ABC transporter permease LptF [Rhodovulum sp. P5]|uniref:LPS export ABC transporter permease LptF n=1 Tax=Rhodovulum sp. P5 TaxID=1564506 RepID=UPI0009DA40DF|nr:LPS export ABC transporter permease LptF [Rhodovulum sp. P5]